MKRLIFVMAALAAAFAVHAQSVTATKKYVDDVKQELLDEMAHFPYFDGKSNDMRVSPVDGVGGFRFVDYSSEDDQFGMTFQPWGDAMWGFALWDKMGFPASTRANPYFGIGPYGLRIPTDNIDNWATTISWRNVANALAVSDQVFDNSNENRFRSINSMAIHNFMNWEFPRAVGRWAETGTVRSAYGIDSASRGFVFYEDIVTNTINEAATSVVETVTFGEWTSDLTMDKDECELDYVKWDDGIWIVYAKDRNFSGIEIARIKADEDAVSLSHTDEYGTFTCTREKFVKRDNVYGFLTVGTSTNLVQSIASHTLSNAVPSIVTNEVAGGWNEWVHGPRVVRVSSFFCAAETSDYSYWVLEFYDENERCVIIQGYGDAPKKEDVSEIRWTDGPSEYTSAKSVRQRQPSRNALGLATLKDIEGVVTRQELTNAVRKVVNTAGRYVWDKDLEVCYRLNAAGGFLDLVAVTNVDVTLPENWAALEAIENEWSAK